MEAGRVNYEYVFAINTPKRVYYLAADSEEEMTAWVDLVCQVGRVTFLLKNEKICFAVRMEWVK